MNTACTITHSKGIIPGGICYRVLMWEDCALPTEALTSWKAARAELLARMRDAGVKGARGNLAR